MVEPRNRSRFTEMAMLSAEANIPARVILFLGAPGSGKGTQSSRLAAQLGIPCLSTGEILRSEAKRNTPAGFELRRILASGSMVDDEMICRVAEARLRRDVPAGGLILDGFPRNVAQAHYLDRLLTSLGLPSPTVFLLNVSTAALTLRLTSRRHCASCGATYNLISRRSLRGSRCEIDGGALVERDDDCAEVIARRLEDFEAGCRPLIDYYRAAELHSIDGDRDPDEIASALLEIATHSDRLVSA